MSDWTYVSLKDCSGCSTQTTYFDPSTSQTFRKTGVVETLTFRDATVTGEVSKDLMGLKFDHLGYTRFLPVSQAQGVQDNMYGAVVGLTPATTDDDRNFLNTMVEVGQADKRSWNLMISTSSEPSSIKVGAYMTQKYDSVPLEPLSVNGTIKYWSTAISDLKYKENSIQLNARVAVWDSGSPISYFPKKDLQLVIQRLTEDLSRDEFSLKAHPEVVYSLVEKQGTQFGMYSVKCSSIKQFSNRVFTLGDTDPETENITIDLDRSEFIVQDSKRGLCNITLGELADPTANYVIFGLNVFRGRDVFFDNDRREVGVENPGKFPSGGGFNIWGILSGCLFILCIIG